MHHCSSKSTAVKATLISHAVRQTLRTKQPQLTTVAPTVVKRTLHTTTRPVSTTTTTTSLRPTIATITGHPTNTLVPHIKNNRIGNGHLGTSSHRSIVVPYPGHHHYPPHTHHSHLWNQAAIRSSLLHLQSTSRIPFRLHANDMRILRASTLPASRGFYSQSELRELDDVVSFYDDKVSEFASQPIQTVTLKTLLGFGRSDSSMGTGTATASAVSEDTQQQQWAKDLAINLDVARYARKELPVRLARLIKATQRLPFIVGTNPYIKRVYKLYYDSFQTLSASPEQIQDKEDLDRFADLLQGLVASHADVIPMLSQGFLECKKYMNTEDIKEFLDYMIRARIGIRLIAEQVISLRDQRDHDNDKPKRPSDVVGVVHTELSPAALIKTCASFVQELCDVNYGSSPEVIINGQTDTTFTYVPVHLEYILCELLKNAVRATVEQSQKTGRSALDPHGRHNKDSSGRPLFSSDRRGGNSEVVIVNQDDDQDQTKRPNDFGHPPVEVTIARGDREVTIRIRDQGGGITRENFDKVFDYSFTTVKNENDANETGPTDAGSGDSPYGVDSIFKGVSRLAMQAGLGGPIAGLGFGLPLTRIYARYFGGDMHLISLQGYGCDVFLKLKQIDETLEDIQI